jgi:hypothetical protein
MLYGANESTVNPAIRLSGGMDADAKTNEMLLHCSCRDADDLVWLHGACAVQPIAG